LFSANKPLDVFAEVIHRNTLLHESGAKSHLRFGSYPRISLELFLLWKWLANITIGNMRPACTEGVRDIASSSSFRTLAARLGMTVHQSPLRFALERIRAQSRLAEASLGDWLLVIANSRGAHVVSLERSKAQLALLPPVEVVSNEDLVGGLCLTVLEDRPHLLRPAAQLISRGVVDVARLKRIALRERLEAVLGSMAREALRIDPAHQAWQQLATAFPQRPPREEPVIHRTRLARPIFINGRPNVATWELEK
jgi:hypothetical protein